MKQYVRMNLLTPDKSLLCIKIYHKANIAMIPMACLSYIETKLNMNTQIMYNALICNISYHSFVSCSSVITDYIKYNSLRTGLRCGNIGIHTIATFGYLSSNLFYNHYNNESR